MQSVKITMTAPFAFCEECPRTEIRTEHIFCGGEIAETFRICKNREICENAVELYRKRVEDGRTV